mmetsp:Transcript_22550/g.21673  ORF Transcript_22550/g.21673 Transcript_22550/m.21673 type:complete len:838 (-) Transcript_22550:162-2675(-)|eukprot:CAMPEP_0197831996 /NCGR_PEP_ID=MMETSP1437-20131217/12888_1 /TAXON_ID=49252 ORGANISM="Eucampia antarctica, Strain CCMP1452" /NCGR_SAMPLE_ID=MMETSP1437 /ASSEMBLY_ACC=CAM_ASM_001096 /LENGTH=837 /DNA_ID=CAMNT_0043435151 /DNA_START=61 /DNA_END=2574 /DNA_ORIENTATION=-
MSGGDLSDPSSVDAFGNSLLSMIPNEGASNKRQSIVSLDDTAMDARILELFFLCERATDDDLDTWEDVRQWLRTHTTAEAREAAMSTGEDNATPLYLACRKCAPVDIIEVLVGVAPSAVEMANNLGWLPMHIACHFGASLDVLRILADAYQDGMKSVDKRGRTPLHFALGNIDKPVSPAAVLLLLGGSVGKCPDMGGMLPLHYACAYGASEAVLNVLLEGNHETIIERDNKGRTPLHYAMGNCSRDASPAIVRTLLQNNPVVINMVESENGYLPLHMLATAAEKLTLEHDGPTARTNAQACLDHYLNAKPDTTTEFFSTFQKLPDWLIDHAVQSPVVQMILNRKIAQRFPTCIQFLDFYALLIILVSYFYAVTKSIDLRQEYIDDATTMDGRPKVYSVFVWGLYIGGVWFFLRELMQVVSYTRFGIFANWRSDPINWVDMGQFLVVFVVALITHQGLIVSIRDYRKVVSVLVVMPFVKFILFLRSLLVGFSVFSSGLYCVLMNLKVFTVTLVIILLMFTTIFHSLFFESEFCNDVSKNKGTDKEKSCPYCENLWQSFLATYTMLLGEVNNEPFLANGTVSCIFFALFMLLVVILLANVLIAIVTDGYSMVRNERSSIVFWKDRLDLIAEMDALSNFLFKFTSKEGDNDPSMALSENSIVKTNDNNTSDSTTTRKGDDIGYYDTNADLLTEGWKALMSFFEDQRNLNPDLTMLSWEFFLYTLLRLCALIIIPIWLILGAVSCGLLLPDQVRQSIFSLSDTVKVGGSEMDERLKELKSLHKESKQWQESVEIDMASDRKNVIVIKSTVMDVQSSVMREMKEIKQIMTMLFELQTALEAD